MIYLSEECKTRRYIIVGLGIAGRAVAESLVQSGALFQAWDDNADSRSAFSYQDTLCALEVMDWQAADTLVLSPGIPLTHPEPHAAVLLAQQHDCEIICDIELLYRSCPDATYIGITGTNGKSTTTALIGHVLRSAGHQVCVGGNIGEPAMKLDALAEGGIYVLELSSYQLDLIDSFHANVGLLLNVTPDHLDRHGDVEGYIAAKMHLFDKMKPKNDTVIIGLDHPFAEAVKESLSKLALLEGAVSFSLDDQKSSTVSICDGLLRDARELGVSLNVAGAPSLNGRHNAQNIAAAWAACHPFGVGGDAFVAALHSFVGLPHRMEIVASFNGVTYVNDSKATNIDAAVYALQSYKDGIFWIAGGKGKGESMAPLKSCYAAIEKAYLVGADAGRFAAFIEGDLPYEHSGTQQSAVHTAMRDAHAYVNASGNDAVVLLSPACASFDQWKNFEERGRAFCELVLELEADSAVAQGSAHAV